MIFSMPRCKLALVLAMILLALLSGVLPALAQYVPERTPRPGERRFHANIFKASHNAYERSESYAEQLDDMNSWCLELDIHWREGQFNIGHNNCDTSRRLNEHLPLVAQSVTWRQKVTVLWFQVNNNEDCRLPSPDLYEPNLQSLINQVFGWSRVYTPAEFYDINGDNGKWPSWQELVRRGKNLIIVTERNKHPLPHFPHPDNYWFFEVTTAPPSVIPRPTDHMWKNNVAFFNTGDVEAFSSFTKGDYWASRIYPGSSCSPSEPESKWNSHVSTGATIVATNCLSNPWTQGSPQVHPPQPTFVNNSATGDEQYGTRRFPFRTATGLEKAIQRTANYGTSTEIWLSPGDYHLTGVAPPAPFTIRNPLLFKAPVGGVLIR